MATAKHSIRDVLDGDYGFGIDSPTVGGGSAPMSGILINSSGRLASIENVVTNYRDFHILATAADPNNPTNAEHLAAGDFTIQDVLRDSVGNTPDGHNIELSNGTPSTYGRTQGLFTNLQNGGAGAGFRHYYHTAQFNKELDLHLDSGTVTTDFAFGGNFGSAGLGSGTFKQANLEFSEFRDFNQQQPTISTTLTGFAGLVAIAFTQAIISASAPTGYSHYDALDEKVDTAGQVSIGGYADGLFIPGLGVDTSYI